MSITPLSCSPAPRKKFGHSHILQAMQSFPSGHTGNAFVAGTFVALYLNAKLKACSNYRTSFWKMLVVVAPIVMAMFIAGSLMIDRNHHPHDIVLSVPLGIMVGLFAYRCHYTSLFDADTNHIPLPFAG